MTLPLLSVVICTRNRAPFLAPCVESVLAQNYPRDRFELIVVDNGSSDATPEIARRFADRGVHYVLEPVPGLSRARNTGRAQAKGDYVGYLDDDATADAGWLQAVADSVKLTQGRAVWIGGAIYLQWAAPEPAWINDELRVPLGYLYWGAEPRELSPTERLGGGNSFYRRDRLLALGGFDERLGRQGGNLLSGEETQLQKRIEREGGRLFYHPKASIHHHVPADRTRPAWFCRRYFWGGVSDTVMWRTLPAGEAVQPSPGGVVSGPTGNRWLRLVSNVLWSALPVGCAPSRIVPARIYLAYVAGRFWGLFRTT